MSTPCLTYCAPPPLLGTQHINPTRAQNLTFRPQIQSASHQVTVFFTKNKKIIDILFLQWAWVTVIRLLSKLRSLQEYSEWTYYGLFLLTGSFIVFLKYSLKRHLSALFIFEHNWVIVLSVRYAMYIRKYRYWKKFTFISIYKKIYRKIHTQSKKFVEVLCILKPR